MTYLVAISKRMFPLLASVALVTGCGEDAKTKEETSGVKDVSSVFLVVSDFTAGMNITPLTVAEMGEELNDTDDFYDTEPDEEDTPTGKCMNEKLDDIKVTADATTLAVGGEVEAGDCMDADPTTFEDYVSHDAAMTIKFFVKATCAGADIRAFDGKRFEEIAADDSPLNDVKCTSSTLVSNTLITTKVTGKAKDAQGKVHDLDLDLRHVLFQGNPSAQPCQGTVNGSDFATADGCLDVQRQQKIKYLVDGEATSDQGQEDFTRLESVGIVSDNVNDMPYHKTGKLKTQINNWTGEMTYANSTTAPTWVLSDGTVTVEGTFQGATGVTLRGIVPVARLEVKKVALRGW